MNYLSFLVDDLETHYYQAELLLYSLAKNTSFTKNNILIHCTTRVKEKFLLFLKEEEYSYVIIEPYLDGKYCNKLQQLPSFQKLNLNEDDAVFLIDTDTYFLNNPIVKYVNKIGGKVVDASNPPLAILSRIFNEAKIVFPKVVPTDWEIENSYTFESNFNGGFYYIPAKELVKVNRSWRKWAEWLYERPELFDTDMQRIHVDQVSFSMMIEDEKLEYQVLASNNNSPIHKVEKQRLFDASHDVSMLHYHRSLNYFGLLSRRLSINPIVDNAIKKANKEISEKKDFIFFKQFNQSFLKLSKSNTNLKKFELDLSTLITKNIKIILHAGTPKTGTTSLQFLLAEKHEELLANGILYPKYYLDTNPPKHQWIVSLLKQNNFNELFIYLKNIYLESIEKNVNTIFLSTEGIFNHWWDFTDEAKEVLRIMAKYFNIKLYVVFREPCSFLESFYKQNLKNPQMLATKCYGKNSTFTEMSKDEWFIKHLDYLGFIHESETIFGKENLELFTYSSKIIDDILKKMNITFDKLNEEKRKNTGQTNISVELLMNINKYNLNASDKKDVINILKKMDKIFNKYNNPEIIDTESISEIKRLFSLQATVLEKKYGLSF